MPRNVELILAIAILLAIFSVSACSKNPTEPELEYAEGMWEADTSSHEIPGLRFVMILEQKKEDVTGFGWFRWQNFAAHLQINGKIRHRAIYLTLQPGNYLPFVLTGTVSSDGLTMHTEAYGSGFNGTPFLFRKVE